MRSLTAALMVSFDESLNQHQADGITVMSYQQISLQYLIIGENIMRGHYETSYSTSADFPHYLL